MKQRMLKMIRLQKLLPFLFASIIALVVSSCFKEYPTELPVIMAFESTADSLMPGDTTILSVIAKDADSPTLYYRWMPGLGTYLSDNTKPDVQWKAPYKEGKIDCNVEVSDGQVFAKQTISVYVSGYLFDSFTHREPIWVNKNSRVNYQNGKAIIEKDTASGDAIYFADLPHTLTPPYAIHMKIGRVKESQLLNSSDKYGVYLNFKNLAADTIVKAMWFRIYPASISKNWRLSVLKDNGNSSSWQNLDFDSQSMSNQIKTGYDFENLIKLVVTADLTFQVYLNDELFYSSTALRDNYLSGTAPPRLILEQVGARTSNPKLFIDDVFLTHKINRKTSEVFHQP